MKGPDHDPDRERVDFTLELPAYFLVERVLAYLGRDPASASERVKGNTFTAGTRLAETPAILRVELERGVARCSVEAAAGHRLVDDAAARASSQVVRLMGLVIDPRPFERRAGRDPLIARLIEGRRGLSIPQTPTVFDALVWVIAGQQVSLPVAFALRRRLTRRAGSPLADGLYAPPSAARVAELEPADLHRLGWSKRKTEYLLDVGRAVVSGELTPGSWIEQSATAVERRLLAVRGLGPWSVNYLMMRALGLADCVPVGDAALARNLVRFFDLDARPDARATRRLMAPFAPHRSLATFHLWALKEQSNDLLRPPRGLSIGDLGLVVDAAGRLVRIAFLSSGESPAPPRSGDELVEDEARTAAVERQLAEYFAGERRRFELELAPEGTEFQQRVWNHLLDIPGR